MQYSETAERLLSQGPYFAVTWPPLGQDDVPYHGD